VKDIPLQAEVSIPVQTHPAGFDQTAVIVPAYNEERFIGSVVILARRYASNVIVVDDGSRDGTAEVAEAAGALVIRHGVNLGKGVALRTGFQQARQLADVRAIVTMDGDGQHNCVDIPELARPIFEGRADLVVGSRFLGKKSETPGWRVFGQQALTLATNLSAQSSLTDSQSGFRAFSRKMLDVFNFDSNDFSVESEMQFIVHNAGLEVIEVPISVVYEEPSKRNPVMHGLQVLRGIANLVSRYRPLFFFGGGGLIILLAGLIWGWYVVDIYLRVRTLAVGYALISALLVIIGSSSLFTGLMLHSVLGLMADIKKSIEQMQPKD
jgi:glycosyltransferase involved in cell wall biosynthesis